MHHWPRGVKGELECNKVCILINIHFCLEGFTTTKCYPKENPQRQHTSVLLYAFYGIHVHHHVNLHMMVDHSTLSFQFWKYKNYFSLLQVEKNIVVS